MASKLIQCRCCDNQVSARASCCPVCGEPKLRLFWSDAHWLLALPMVVILLAMLIGALDDTGWLALIWLQLMWPRGR